MTDKVFNRIIAIVTIIIVGILIYKISTKGIAWISPIGYFKK